MREEFATGRSRLVWHAPGVEPLSPRRGTRLILAILWALWALPGNVAPALAQTRILPLGDSITHGGQAHASYRHELWFDLVDATYAVEFVGRQNTLFAGSTPNPAWYPDYGSFDPDHEGWWGNRTDEILDFIDEAAAAAQPDVVLIHLGTNDIGQNGAQGVVDANANLRQIIASLRAENPAVAILLARVIPIGAGSGYGSNAAQVGPLNDAIDQIALDLDSGPSPVIVVDLNAGFDLLTMMQLDELHPNVTGEGWMADRWLAALAPLLGPGNPLPDVEITSPGDGATFTAPASITIEAAATDVNGSISQVSFLADSQPLGVVTQPPWIWTWTSPPLGVHVLEAVAEDDEGATASSAPVAILVAPPGAPVPIAVANASFEEPVLVDQDLAPGPGNLGGWSFAASANTFLGIFNPPAGSYPTAGGSGTPSGADGINAAYLFNNGGPAEFVEASQVLAETLAAGSLYELRVAIGRFLPGQPYDTSSYGGYRIELLAGTTVIASDSDTVDPAEGEFLDAVARVASDSLDPALLGQPLAIRLTISSSDAPRSTHFDDVRLTRAALPAVPTLSAPFVGALALAMLAAARAIPGRRRLG